MATGLTSLPYTKDILRLAAGQEHHGSIAEAVHVERRSRTCGATIRLDLVRDEQLVRDVAVVVTACAYGQAATTLMTRHAKGKSAAQVRAARDGISEWLSGRANGTPWPEIELLSPALERPGRHGAILLPFEALLEAMETRDDG